MEKNILFNQRIRLRHLHTFVAVAQQGTLGRAAETLSLSQPALSKTLNELEELTGVRLFERGRLGAQLTTMGEANQAGLQWSKERSDQMIAELKQKGSLDANGRCPAAHGAATGAVAGAAAANLASSTGGADDEDDAPQDEAPAKPAAKKAATTGKTKASSKSKTPAAECRRTGR